MAPKPPDPMDELKAKVSALETKVGSVEQNYQALLKTPPDAKILYDMARAAYAEYGNQIRHFSSTRSAVTVFLVTVGMTAFAGYLDKKFRFLADASLVFAVAALCVCLWFSYWTEKHALRYRDLWNLLNGAKSNAKLEKLDYDPGFFSILARMAKDPMNWILVLAVLAFICYANHTLSTATPAVPYYPWE